MGIFDHFKARNSSIPLEEVAHLLVKEIHASAIDHYENETKSLLSIYSSSDMEYMVEPTLCCKDRDTYWGWIHIFDESAEQREKSSVFRFYLVNFKTDFRTYRQKFSFEWDKDCNAINFSVSNISFSDDLNAIHRCLSYIRSHADFNNYSSTPPYVALYTMFMSNA